MRAHLFAWFAVFALVGLIAACDSGDDQTEPSTDGDETADGDTDGDIDGDAEATDGDEEGEVEYPDPSFVYEVRTPPASLADEPFAQEFPEFFKTAGEEALADVRALAVFGQDVWAGTGDGLFVKLNGRDAFARVPLLGAPEPSSVVAIARRTYNDRVVATLAGHVVLAAPDGAQSELIAFPHGAIVAVAADGGQLIAATADAIYHYTEASGEFEQVSESALSVRSLALGTDGTLYIAGEAGVNVVPPAGQPAVWNAENGKLVDNDARAVAVCGNRVVVATAQGLAVHDGATVALRRAEPDGLPTDNLIAIDCTDQGVLIGHEIGATYLKADFSHTDHYISGRWIPDNRAPAVALDANGGRWIGTAGGVSRIYLRTRTLAEKERAFHAMAPYFYRMDGVEGAFMSSDGRTPEPETDPSEMSLGDKDNDGLWTQMMIGGWCFAYAATGDEEYYRRARLAMNNMLLLIDIPAPFFEEAGLGAGYVSRSLIREDETDLWNAKKSEAEQIGDKGILRWNEAEHGDWRYLFKVDTSSDEVAGHFFGFPVYYDLCAKDDAERREIADRAVSLADYILRHDFLLLDLDGTKTTHGHWNPEALAIAVDGVGPCIDAGYDIEACFEADGGGGWLNALEILGTMLAAYHMSGDTKFYDAFLMLVDEHRYDEVAMPDSDTWTVTNPRIKNHSDHELAMLAYTTLLRYEPDETRRAYWRESLKFLYDYERPERNPWWTSIYALSGGVDPDVESAVRTLREIPDDLREWYFDNSHRKDANLDVVDRFEDPQFDRVFPFDEIRTMWWNGNPYSVVDGGDGRGWQAPTAWLLPYYMARYAGLIEE